MSVCLFLCLDFFPKYSYWYSLNSVRIFEQKPKTKTCAPIYRRKKEKERSNSGDSATQTSSPGGWQARLSSLNFFHLQASNTQEKLTTHPTHNISGPSLKKRNLYILPPSPQNSIAKTKQVCVEIFLNKREFLLRKIYFRKCVSVTTDKIISK